MADFENSLETLLRFESLQHEQADGRNRIIVQLAKEFKISERRIESRWHPLGQFSTTNTINSD